MATKTKKTATPKTPAKPALKTKTAAKKPSLRKLKRPTNDERMMRFLSRAGGTTIADMQREIKMQVHSIRGALSTLKKKRGINIAYDRETGRYSKVD